MNEIDNEEAKLINKTKLIIDKSRRRYGYRRVTLMLKNKGLVVNHKRVYRIMKDHNLLCDKFHRKTRKYYSYKGEVGRIANNELNIKFNVDKPNKVLLTDVTEFKVGSNKLFLSPILDLYNLEIVSFSISTRPTINFTNRSLNAAINKRSKREDFIIHSYQGFHYQHHT